jgi:hypothetical protein
MDEIEDLAQLIRVQVDEPALAALHEMYTRGLVTELDVEKFKTSVGRYKAAVLQEHQDLDPQVRHELIKSLLSDYQVTMYKMVAAIERRVRQCPPWQHISLKW